MPDARSTALMIGTRALRTGTMWLWRPADLIFLRIARRLMGCWGAPTPTPRVSGPVELGEDLRSRLTSMSEPFMAVSDAALPNTSTRRAGSTEPTRSARVSNAPARA